MITASIVGGLGNQLFQYAAAKALATYHNVPLKLDISFYKGNRYVNFKLDHFTFDIVYCSPNESIPPDNQNYFSRALQYVLPYYKRTPFYEPHFHYYSKFLKAPSSAYLKGLWQSDKYFLPIRDILLKELLVKPALVSHLNKKATHMRQENSISIHIRRGDYLHPNVLQQFGLLSKEYYLKSISLIMQKYPDAKIYFFSDDIIWVEKFINEQETFIYPHEYITDHVTKTDLEDFYLMQQCKHHIIANSTFSWWSAWLSNHSEKIVVAPKKWFHKVDFNFEDIVPEQWLTV